MLLSAGWDNTVQVMDCICMYAFLCVYIYLYVYTYIHDTFTYMCYICVYMYTCVCVCVCDIYMCVHILSLCVCTCIYRYIQIIHIHIYGAQIWDIYSLCIYVHMYTYIYDISTCMVSGYETRGQMCHSGAFQPRYFLFDFFVPQIWDPRTDVPQRSIFGAHITGDSMDRWGNFIVTGSWRPEKQLQVVTTIGK